MSAYTQTKIERLFQRVVVKDKEGNVISERRVKRAEPIPAEPRQSLRVQGCKYPAMVSRGQVISAFKEWERQKAHPERYTQYA